ncbi:MAG: cytochrome c peroxidase [Bacteroidota bacterium]
MERIFYILMVFTVLFSACREDKLDNPLDHRLRAAIQDAAPDGSLEHFVLPDRDDYDNIPQDPHNPLNAEKVHLGQMLFFETGLALSPMHDFGKESFSCGTCHIPSAGFVPGSKQGIADGGIGFGLNGESRTMVNIYDESELDVQGARPISLINVATVVNTSWNGQFGSDGANEGTEDVWDNNEATKINKLGFAGLESQNIEGLHVHRMIVDKAVADLYGYTEHFDECFPEFDEEERYSDVTGSFAISAYLRTLLSTEAPFQKWLEGNENAMSDQQKRGALLFFTKANCYQCHNGKSLNNPSQFYAIGVKDLYEAGAFQTDINDRRNLGRGGFTGKQEDLYKFKVPQLYNLKRAGFYFHGSSKESLREVVEYFNVGLSENTNVPDDQIARQFKPLNMTEEEIDDLVEFLENGLYDETIQDYMPKEILSGNCFPNNDPFSKNDLGCE